MARPRRLIHGEEATFVDHLEELRQRLLMCAAAVTVGWGVALLEHRRVLALLTKQLPPDHRKLVTLGVTEPLLTSLWLSLYLGLAIALPVILWQSWAFFVPAFDEQQRKLLRAFVLLATALMVAGVLFGYFVALPAAVKFLTHFDTATYDIQVQARPFIGFATRVLMAMAVVFELPILVVGLTRLGVLTTSALRRNRRTGYFAVACVGVALPGIDPITTFIETIPLCLLYEASIWLSLVLDRRSKHLVSTPKAGDLAIR